MVAMRGTLVTGCGAAGVACSCGGEGGAVSRDRVELRGAAPVEVGRGGCAVPGATSGLDEGMDGVPGGQFKSWGVWSERVDLVCREDSGLAVLVQGETLGDSSEDRREAVSPRAESEAISVRVGPLGA